MSVEDTPATVFIEITLSTFLPQMCQKGLIGIRSLGPDWASITISLAESKIYEGEGGRNIHG